MVVITIIGILAVITLPTFARARYQAQLSACMQNERNLAAALETYSASDTGHVYPDPSGGSLPNVLVTGGFLNKLPSCPAAAGSQYGYEVNAERTVYTVSCGGAPNYHTVLGYAAGFPKWSNRSGTIER